MTEGGGKTETIILIDNREKVFASATKDIISFGLLIATAWTLNTQMPPSGWLNAALSIAWILWMLGKSQTKPLQMTIEEARAHLDRLAESEARS